MKYDLKAMGFAPIDTDRNPRTPLTAGSVQAEHLLNLFIFSETPQGHDFWWWQAHDGIDDAGRAALVDMYEQWINGFNDAANAVDALPSEGNGGDE